MTFQTGLAFVERYSHSQGCTKQKRSSRHHRYQSSKTALGGSVEDMVAMTGDSMIPASIGEVTPAADIYATTNALDNVVFANSGPAFNVPEITSYLLITVAFAALMFRTMQVEDAVQKRQQMQEKVRLWKLKEMGEGKGTPEKTQQTLQLYEDAVRHEENMRTILPGVRISPPSASGPGEENAQAIAKQYLGEEFDIGLLKRKRGDEGTSASMAVGIVAVVALSQVGLMLAYMG